VLAGQQLLRRPAGSPLAGIRHQFPEASEDRCLEILRERLQLQRRLEAKS